MPLKSPYEVQAPYEVPQEHNKQSSWYWTTECCCVFFWGIQPVIYKKADSMKAKYYIFVYFFDHKDDFLNCCFSRIQDFHPKTVEKDYSVTHFI